MNLDKSYISIVLLSLITLTACQGDFELGNSQPKAFLLEENNFFASDDFKYEDWTSFNDETALIKEFAALNTNQDKIKINVIKLKKENYNFNLLEDLAMPKTLANWQDENKDLDLIVNGAFFDENNQATGGIIVDGQGEIYSEGGKNVYEGAVIIDDENNLEIRYLPSAALKEKDKYNDVLVSFPYLIKNGSNYLKEADSKKAARTLIGSDDEYIYFISCPYAYFTFYEAMLWAQGNLPDLKQLLNLDGGSSTGISANIDDEVYLINSLGAVPNVITAKRK